MHDNLTKKQVEKIIDLAVKTNDSELIYNVSKILKDRLDKENVSKVSRKMSKQENIYYVYEFLYEFKDKYPMQLSGGMRQRVALIRTLAIRPQILLLDEAFSALDYQTRLMVTDDIYKILKQEGITAIMVTHDISEAISMSDRVIVLSQRPATVKNIYNIEFDIEHRTPLNCRESPQFSKYFNTMWKELEEYDKEAEKK